MPVKYDMTIDETIEYLEKTARNQLECADKIDELGCDSTSTRSMADYHNRLANWLRELVHLRNITEYLRDFIDCFGSMDSMHYNEDIIEWAEEELRVEMRSEEISNMTCKEMNEWAKTFMDGLIEGSDNE